MGLLASLFGFSKKDGEEGPSGGVDPGLQPVEGYPNRYWNTAENMQRNGLAPPSDNDVAYYEWNNSTGETVKTVYNDGRTIYGDQSSDPYADPGGNSGERY